MDAIGRFFIDFACSEQRLAIDTVISRKRVGEVDAERRGA
jgi:very-short-patch-repair endonuclease